MAIRNLLWDILFPRPSPHCKPQTRELYANLRVDLEIMLNGIILFGTSIVHHCTASVGCKCTNFDDTIHKMTQLVIRTVFLRRPKLPQLKEWTALSQALRYLAFGVSLNGILVSLWSMAIEVMKASTTPAPPTGGAAPLEDVPAADVEVVEPPLREAKSKTEQFSRRLIGQNSLVKGYVTLAMFSRTPCFHTVASFLQWSSSRLRRSHAGTRKPKKAAWFFLNYWIPVSRCHGKSCNSLQH